MLPSATYSVVLCLLLSIYNINCDESQREVAIIKQINRVNEDGTYTFGYEAADGSFKIETRDVMGNVKGMFGFVDDQGELKRVSYTASNGTGFQATTGSLPLPTPTTGGVTRKPVLIFRHPPGVIPTPVTRSPVIQHIPRRSTTIRPDFSSSAQPDPLVSSPTESPQRPVRILVTKRPIGGDERTGHDLRRQLMPIDPQSLADHLKKLQLSSQQSVRDQLRRQQLIGADHLRQSAENKRQVDSVEEDSADRYTGGIGGGGDGHRLYPHRAVRLQPISPVVQHQDPRQLYRNQLLETSGLKPDLPPRRYYPRPPVSPVSEEDDDYEDPAAMVPAMIPVANRVLPVLRGRVDDGYPPVNYYNRAGYSRLARQRLPGYAGVDHRYAGGLDYEALRDELMQYLIQYLDYRLGRQTPYSSRQLAYQPSYQQPYYPERYYQRQPVYRQQPYREGYNGYQGYPGPIPSQYPGNIPPNAVPNAVHIPANYQYPNVQQYSNNVQYSNGQDGTGTVNIPSDSAKQENRVKVSTLKQRMVEVGDANDNIHTQPMSSSSLIHMLLATPTPRRPLLPQPQPLIQEETPIERFVESLKTPHTTPQPQTPQSRLDQMEQSLQRLIKPDQSRHQQRNIQTIPHRSGTTTRQPIRSVEIVTPVTTSNPVTSTTTKPVTEKDEMQAVS